MRALIEDSELTRSIKVFSTVFDVSSSRAEVGSEDGQLSWYPGGVPRLTIEENNLCSRYPNRNRKRGSLCFPSAQRGPGAVPDIARKSPRMCNINWILVRGSLVTATLARTKALDGFEKCARRAGE